MPGEGKSVTPARATWDTFWFGGTIVQVGLEKLGYSVNDPKTLNNPARYPALAAGDIQYETDTVMPNATAFVEKVKDEVDLLGPIMNPGSIQGYLVDRKTADANGITSVEDLKKPEVVKLFDGDGDGKADLTGCNPGWNCEGIINHHLKAYGLEDTVEHVQGEYNVLVGDAVARYNAGSPVLLYAWYPNTATVQMMPDKDLVWLTGQPYRPALGQDRHRPAGHQGLRRRRRSLQHRLERHRVLHRREQGVAGRQSGRRQAVRDGEDRLGRPRGPEHRDEERRGLRAGPAAPRRGVDRPQPGRVRRMDRRGQGGGELSTAAATTAPPPNPPGACRGR